MATFTDLAGREWDVGLTFRSAFRLEDKLQLKVPELVADEGAKLKELGEAPAKLLDLLWCLCQPAAAKAGVDQEGFEAAIDYPTLALAMEAFLAGLLSFTHGPKVGASYEKHLRPVLERREAVAAEAAERALSAWTSGNGTGNTPGSAGMTPST